MNYPLISEYEIEIKKYGSSLLKFQGNYEFIPSIEKPIKIFNYGSGAFAGIFKIRDTHTNKIYALRCFLSRSKTENIHRIRAISHFLENISEPWLCKTHFYEQGICIKGNTYPIILMEWTNGQKINDYVSSIINNNNKLNELQEKIIELSHSLENKGIAHGDIQSGNLLVEQHNGSINLKIVDYDAMFIPTLEGENASEKGHSSFQHPMRDMKDYDIEIDRFSFWLLLTTLEALKYDKTLWNKDLKGGFNDEDNFLFKAKDLLQPSNSELIKKLNHLQQESLKFYLTKLLNDTSSIKREKPYLYHSNISFLEEKISEKSDIVEKEVPIVINEEIIPLPSTLENTQNDFLIESIPSNANVYTDHITPSNHIGVTPIILDISKFSSKKIIIEANGKNRVFYLNRNQRNYKINL